MDAAEYQDYLRRYAKATAQFTVLAEKTPKSKRRYVFIGRGLSGFSGNTKYLFLHMLRRHPELECRYLTQDKQVYKELCCAKLPALLFPSPEATEFLVRAGTVVVEAISFRNHLYYPLIAKARQIQLWHGVGNKKIGFQLKGSPALAGKDQTLVEDHSNYDLVVSTSPFYTDEVFRPSMHAREFVSLGYPRTDILFRPVDKGALVGCDSAAYAQVVRARKKGPVVLYAPTFRDSKVNPLTQDVLNFEAFVDFFGKIGAHLVLKPHGRVPVSVSNLPAHVTFCDPNSDIYPFFPLVDVLITDYSSIYTEYLLLDRPVIFFWADYASYMSVDRGFQFPFEEMCPGPKCHDGESLLREVRNALGSGPDAWQEQRLAMRDKAFLHKDGKSSERIAAHLLQGEYAPGGGQE
ncbi:MAG: CDP-glycerol glycerophosphotransferase family protein [Desulfovibrionaceae bacterium]